jgi:hypothetical protein
MDISTVDGLLDLIAVRCLVELSRALDERTYIKQPLLQDEQDEIDAATARYRIFITWFSERYFVVINGEWLNASYLFNRRLVNFAATTVCYVKEQMEDSHRSPVPEHTLTDVSLTKQILHHLSSGLAELVPAFLAAK